MKRLVYTLFFCITFTFILCCLITHKSGADRKNGLLGTTDTTAIADEYGGEKAVDKENDNLTIYGYLRSMTCDANYDFANFKFGVGKQEFEKMRKEFLQKNSSICKLKVDSVVGIFYKNKLERIVIISKPHRAGEVKINPSGKVPYSRDSENIEDGFSWMADYSITFNGKSNYEYWGYLNHADADSSYKESIIYLKYCLSKYPSFSNATDIMFGSIWNKKTNVIGFDAVFALPPMKTFDYDAPNKTYLSFMTKAANKIDKALKEKGANTKFVPCSCYSILDISNAKLYKKLVYDKWQFGGDDLVRKLAPYARYGRK